jgi:hypothetical protein
MTMSLSPWLFLREPADHAARSHDLACRIAAALPAREPVRVLDLATGTGSNLRFLVDLLPPRQRWLAVDRDPLLLAEVPARMADWAAQRGAVAGTEAGACTISGNGRDCRVETRQMDLGALDDPRPFDGIHLVTCSALCDLVSAGWIARLAAHGRAAGAAILLALTYNGRSACEPIEPADDLVRDLFNEHQARDKGLGGPAAGPGAVDVAVARLGAAGYHVEREPSDWKLAPATRELQRELIRGWAGAAMEMAPELAGTIADWQARRIAHVDAGRSRLTVGHDDVAAWMAVR